MKITPQMIENTQAFSKLEKFKQNLLVKKSNRSVLETAFIHHSISGEILPNIGGSNTGILKEIIHGKARCSTEVQD
ncbi:hypothetical protein JJC03_09345 [Flavobacterium oreochromis]|uniref:hypothetical protein n=1 Tax=Flavobacterium oreochromis TaxID=2906078 RepID=UPI001CE68FAF|nr:hypothetical protein [Flavobacterium oreochromis]QYS85442.1 hypothetical protein JJC03_09345 [Flavobacterium oreochromis]